MNLVSAKCPNCGANIEVSPEMEATKCKSCGSAILVEDAITKYKVEVSGQVSMSGISSVKNDIERGNQCLKANDWQEAFETFNTAIKKQADNYDAWMGCLTAMTQNFTWIDYTWVKLDGINGLESTIGNCLIYANQEQRQKTKANIMNLIESMEKIEKQNFEIKMEERERSKNKSILCGILGFLIPILGFYTAFTMGDAVVLFFILSLPTGLILLIACLVYMSGIIKPELLKDQQVIQYINKIGTII